MNYQLAEFEFSAGEKDQLPISDLPEIIFSGKSNVGKSSLINKLLNRKSLARVSATPGKTATINSYKLLECRFIDLPGYGYAKVSASEKKRWGNLVEGYFNQVRNIRLVVQILDIRHKPSLDDISMLNFLIEKDIPFVVACTKKDKLNKTELEKQLAVFSALFQENEITFLPFSSVKGDGVEELKTIIEQAIL
ncbi:MAG: ribosome biogenesis GTP-binding protein YihA/YsxC [Oscillospiraceae bacterium]